MSGISQFMYCWSLAWRILSIILLMCEMSAIPKSDWLYSLQPEMEKLHTVGKNKTGSWGSDRELLIAKFRPKLKNIGETTRSFRNELNQIPYDYTVEVTNGFNGLDLIDRMPWDLWMEICNLIQEVEIKTIPKKEPTIDL